MNAHHMYYRANSTIQCETKLILKKNQCVYKRTVMQQRRISSISKDVRRALCLHLEETLESNSFRHCHCHQQLLRLKRRRGGE